VTGSRWIDPQTLKQKYVQERDKRLAARGGRRAALAKDVNNNLTRHLWRKSAIDRAPLNEEMDVLVVGGGMSGIMTASRLIRNGVTNIRLLERGADFGGTWVLEPISRRGVRHGILHIPAVPRRYRLCAH